MSRIARHHTALVIALSPLVATWSGRDHHADRSPQDSLLRANRIKARPHDICGLLPLPEGEGWGEGLQTIDRCDPPHPHALPPKSYISDFGINKCRTRVTPSSDGERESRRAALEGRARQQSLCQR